MTQILDIQGPVPCVHFGALLKARAFGEGKGKAGRGEPKYSGMFLHKPDDPEFKIIKEAAVAAAKEKWPGRDIGADYKSGELKMPWQSGDAVADRRLKKLQNEGKEDDGRGDWQRGYMVVKAGSKNAPRLAYYDANRNAVEVDISKIDMHRAKFFSGAECSYEINLVAMDAIGEDGHDRVVAYLNIVCSTGKGERVGGGKSASEAFAGYAGKATEEDPTAGKDDLDDDIPF